ncbi:MAG: class I SAM-dependent methyltransferase [Planctomycetaceae bacterium]|nr:class I SAM-dependent methyltransferase [Planctomycetaceae bacterium]MCB9950913.1 class I SAM-dependent methyltransferase [Planctomycetaceae bacterium]
MLTALFASAIHAAELGRFPDTVVRLGMRKLIADRARLMSNMCPEQRQETMRQFLESCRTAAIAEVPEKANEQHYEVESDYFQLVLGYHLKYSCCYFSEECENLKQAEEAALQITCERAGIVDGMSILELGCGWGSLTLWMAKHYPNSRITAVSNSAGQRKFIERQAEMRGLHNVTVITADMNTFQAEGTFDRVMSIEMFEHMRNHEELLRRVSTWLNPGGRLFVHIFCSGWAPYLFEENGPQDWMTTHFFAGGMMPSSDLLLRYQRDLRVIDHWQWDGTHYAKTCEAWLQRHDAQANSVQQIFTKVYGVQEAAKWSQRWRMFYMACAELFAFNKGNSWWVSHYLFEKPSC